VVAEQIGFRVSAGLKDLIGRELIVDDFVAVFELVKNSFDAHASQVKLVFFADRLVVADNGKGMSRADIRDKWLFVAYSAKREGTEDDDYRDKIGERGHPFAGAKGVGRFSCDRLGSALRLSSQAEGLRVQVLEIDWTHYEGNLRKQFGDVLVDLSEAGEFAEPELKPLGETGTIIEIRNPRAKWDRPKLQALKRELTKLIDPFAEGATNFEIEIVAPAEVAADEKDQEYNKNRSDTQEPRLLVNGPIQNPILDAIGKRTTGIRVRIVQGGNALETTLEDRGETIYRIREPNPYPRLMLTAAKADIYFLNRSAKAVFAHRMGLKVVQFGSIFLFRNGFRVFPIGADDDDFFELNRRKQQGQRRFLGGRDLIGRVDIKGVAGFDEASSRNNGLIKTAEVEDLVAFVREKCVRRLERYVVDITWKDKPDKDVDDTSRMRLDESSALITQLVSRLAATDGIELLEYSKDLVRIVDEKSQAFEGSLKALELLAEQTGDPDLLMRVDAARARIRALEAAEAEAREAERRAETRAMAAEHSASIAETKYSNERQRNEFLMAASSLDSDTILNLHHQIMIHAADVHHEVKYMMGRLRSDARVGDMDWINFLDRVSYRNSQILTAARFATKGGYKQQSVEVEADLMVYIRDYIETVSTLWAPRGISVSVNVNASGNEFKRKFKLIEVGIVIDNLVANAAKAHASKIHFDLMFGKGSKPPLIIEIADDGTGWSNGLPALERVFEKGVTTTEGSGLGLYHVKQVIENLRGTVTAHAGPYSKDLDGAHLTIWIPA
jgi:signal transduction histidine kinase